MDNKESACNAGDSRLEPWVGKIPWWRKWQPTAWEVPRTEEPDGLMSIELQRVRHDRGINTFAFNFSADQGGMGGTAGMGGRDSFGMILIRSLDPLHGHFTVGFKLP